ncbi:MAG: molybdate ABC transporter permease subunit [Cyanobacteriota bacterium]
MDSSFFSPLLLTFKLASITTIILLIISIPLAYWLAYSSSKFKAIIETLVSMPLVLPPSVLGFYLLIAFSNENFLGKFLKTYFDLQLAFTFFGLVIASIIFSLPFMVQPIQAGFSNLPIQLKEASYTLGKSKIETLFKVLLPNIKASILTGIVISFTHTIGEFGVVLMIGGNIPNETRVVSLAIYDEVEALNYSTANQYALILFAISFSILLLVYTINKKYLRNR